MTDTSSRESLGLVVGAGSGGRSESRMGLRAWWATAVVAWLVSLAVVEEMAYSVGQKPQPDQALWVAMLAVLPLIPLLASIGVAGVRALVGGRAAWRDASVPKMLIWTSLVLAMVVLPVGQLGQ